MHKFRAAQVTGASKAPARGTDERQDKRDAVMKDSLLSKASY